MRDLSDDFIQKPEDAFPTGKLCQARLLSVSQIDSEAKLSLKDSAVIGDQKAREEIKKIAVGDVVTGVVQRVTQDGVYITLKGTSLTGMSRRAAAITDAQKSLSEEFEMGDVVRCKVLSVAKNSLKIGLGLRAQYFKKGAVQAEAASDDDSEETSGSEDGFEDGSEDGSEEDSEGDEMDVDEDEEGSEGDSEEEEGSGDSEEEDSDSEDGVNDRIRLVEEGEDSTDEEMEQMIRDAALKSGSEDEDEDNDSEEDSEEESEEEIPAPKGKGTAKAAPAKKSAKAAVESDSDDEPVSSVFARTSAAALSKNGKDALGDLQWDDSAPLLVSAWPVFF
jgi:ribosomal protein S1